MTVLRALTLAIGLLFAPAPALAAPPATMKAVRLSAYGPAENLKLEEIPTPTPGKGDVLIKVYAAAVNPVDWKIRDGKFPLLKLPATLGFDVSGVVETVGEGAPRFKPGDEVYVYLPLARAGGYAEYALASEKDVAKKPAKVDHVHAAAVPLAGLTAWQALFDQAGLKEGQSVLIHAGAGGVGHFAVQFAHARGARVYATASESNQAFLKELGADVVIDYKSQKFEDIAKDVDVVLDSIGGETQARSLGCVKKGGTLVSIVGMPDQAKCKDLGITGKAFLVQPNADQLATIATMIDEGKLKPHVSEQIPLADAAKAHQLSETGRTKGKIVLTVR